MRLFLAVFPPAAVQSALHAAAEPLRRTGGSVSWVKPENLHYTMRFLGELGEDGARRAGEAAEEAAKSARAFEAVAGEFGAFPNARRARVLWIGLSRGGEELVALAGALDRGLAKRGFDPPDKRFTAHLTLGRVRDQGGDWTAPLAAQRAPEAARFTVDKLCLVESKLSPRGSTYTVRVAAPLPT